MTATSGPGFSLMQEAIGIRLYGDPVRDREVQRAGRVQDRPPGLGAEISCRQVDPRDYQVIASLPGPFKNVRFYLRAFNLSERFVFLRSSWPRNGGHLRENMLVPAESSLGRKKRRGAPWDRGGGWRSSHAGLRGGRAPRSHRFDPRCLRIPKTDDGEAHARLVERINKNLKNRNAIVERRVIFWRIRTSDPAYASRPDSLYAVKSSGRKG